MCIKFIMTMKSYLAAAAALLALSACSPKAEEINVIPCPQKIEVSKGVFKVAGKPVSVDAKAVGSLAKQNINQFAQDLTLTTGKQSLVAESLAEGGFSFSIDKALSPEEYTIDIDKKSVKVAASDDYGILYAIQTLRQMLPVEIFSKEAAPSANWVLPCSSIQDKPRFAYRGMMLDVGRHFFSVDEVKKYLDVMALHKMNRFHWHLTEDQGWRVEIKSYPRLTEIGAYRDSTVVGRYDSGKYDGKRYGGFYTQEEIRDVVSYASSLGITIIPEVDLPGHMVAALASYPELGCTGKSIYDGGPYRVWTKWGVSKDVLCPGKESTFTFLESVLTEIMDLFPSEYIDIGGDECPKDAWKQCPDCQRRIKELGLTSDGEHSAEVGLQNYVTARVQKFLNDHGRKIIGWDEILEGDLAEGATVMSWRGVQGGVKAADKGYDVIMTPKTYLYFDYYQSDKKDIEPLAIGGYLPIDTVYSYEPYNDFKAEARKHILGVQANLWTEYIARPDHLEYMLLPRMDALSEIQWCDADKKDYERFKESLGHMMKIYDVLGYTYSKDILGEYGLPGVPGGTN